MDSRGRGRPPIEHFPSDPSGAAWPEQSVRDWMPIEESLTLARKFAVLATAGRLYVLGILARQGPLTLPQLAELAQMTDVTTRRCLHDLRRVGLVEQLGLPSKYRRSWTVTDGASERLADYLR
ncbi:helix-turn-helix domain-containing protein [Allobranchiibius sp. GilTou38]|uniref:helix-turn-helix domain-containing protein n=1 Tax=Allobranchiibius sp. GilTou38 TaxID=2815210 RepID=UPI001AA146C1|nr:helix-turn-helix domain-containing protein [Allobranchiibius sp. GilTou38]MBO1767065.1 helix-turn-helix domain-containing protein [Allobranchiibius sp. GilTou38]